MKRIYVLNGHPAETSLSNSFAETYAMAAREAGHDVRLTHLFDLSFDADFGNGGYKQAKTLEPDLETFLNNLEWSEHFVLATPMWWGGLPAKLKGLFDRALLPGRTFDPGTIKGGFPAPMLTGRSARVILTSDTPGWYMRLFLKNALLRQIRHQILGFVGLKPTKFSYFASASNPKKGVVETWLLQVRKNGRNAA